jgi:Tfp pilus assembly protein PilX
MHNRFNHQGSALIVVLVIHLLVIMMLMGAVTQLVLTLRNHRYQMNHEQTFALADQILIQSEKYLIKKLQTEEMPFPQWHFKIIPAFQPDSWWEDPSQNAIQPIELSDKLLSGKRVIEPLSEQEYFRITVRARAYDTDTVTVLQSTIQVQHSDMGWSAMRLTWNWW